MPTFTRFCRSFTDPSDAVGSTFGSLLSILAVGANTLSTSGGMSETIINSLVTKMLNSFKARRASTFLSYRSTDSIVASVQKAEFFRDWRLAEKKKAEEAAEEDGRLPGLVLKGEGGEELKGAGEAELQGAGSAVSEDDGRWPGTPTAGTDDETSRAGDLTSTGSERDTSGTTSRKTSISSE